MSDGSAAAGGSIPLDKGKGKAVEQSEDHNMAETTEESSSEDEVEETEQHGEEEEENEMEALDLSKILPQRTRGKKDVNYQKANEELAKEVGDEEDEEDDEDFIAPGEDEDEEMKD